jgi:lipopolysaccharide transport system ATP-binding protein
MKSAAIRVEGLGKRYRVGARRRPGTLRDVVADAVRAPLRRRTLAAASGAEWHWALREISFELAPGRVLGIVGGNGAGKSTLLKILSRITEPTEGRAEVRGRVGSLLEVGTGFHSELTGRENVFLSGAILGMRRAEIVRRFDEIVEFAEVGRFLDTPIKHYSSGMQMRLAFAVAAHLEPEILLVDEVLAVGDAAFQRKCLGKMSHVAGEGRTVLFVSHNMAAVQALCDSAVWLREGRIVAAGGPGQVVSTYLQSSAVGVADRCWSDPAGAPGNERIRFHRARVAPAEDAGSPVITTRTPFTVELEYWDLRGGEPLAVALHLFNQEGTLIFHAGSAAGGGGERGVRGLYRDSCRVPGDLLNDGIHRIEVNVFAGEEVVFRLEDLLTFDVLDSPERRGSWFGKWVGAVRPLLDWRT